MEDPNKNIQAQESELENKEKLIGQEGWGGSPTIIGSPQGKSSELSPEKVIVIVEKHLNKTNTPIEKVKPIPTPEVLTEQQGSEGFPSLRQVIDSLPIDMQTMVNDACLTAALVHEGQKRIGGEDYIKHLERVTLACANYAQEKKISAVDQAILMTASVLHDAIEDTGMTEEEVTTRFGESVACIVQAVSHDRLPDGSLNEDEPADVFLTRVAEGGPLAVLVKRYDRIDNMNSLNQTDDDFRRAQILATKIALTLKTTEDANNKSALSIWEKMDLEGTRMIHRAMTRAEAPDHLSGEQMIQELKQKLVDTSFITPRQFLGTPTGIDAWKTMKVATVGLPQSGKSVMGGMFKDVFRSMPEAPSFLRIMCVPDGETGEHQKIVANNPEMADTMMRARRGEIKAAGGYFTPASIDRYYKDVKNIGLAVTMIDLGGNPSPENKKILTFANSAMVIVSEKGLKSDDLKEWIALLNERGIPIVGFICSGFFDEQDTQGEVDENGVFFGSVHYAHRGQIDYKNRPTIGQFDKYLIELNKRSEDANVDVQGYYLEHALANLQATSRTASGVVNTEATKEKASSMSGIDGKEVADKAIANFTAVIEQLFVDRKKNFANTDELRVFVESIARKVNDGITKEGVLIREHDSDKYPYTPTDKLSHEMEIFYNDFFKKLDDGTNAHDLAAWVEYRIDLTDHFFADGCGKTSKAISSWVLMRNKNELPTYRDRKELYANAPTQIRGKDEKVDEEQYKKWLAYYKSLFTKKEK